MANIFPPDGNAGAGTANPTLGLIQVQLTQLQAWNERMGIALTVAGNDNPVMLYARPSPTANGDYNWFFARPANDQGLVIDPNGDVMINGALKIKDWEISVPDYVFDGDYPLPDLHDVERYVRSHGHLPEIPAAAEMISAGLDAATMILLLLKKVEELTLYLIRHERRLCALEERVRALEAP